MFKYATYNGVPIITYVLIGLTTSILGLVTLNPGILELNENGTQPTISEAVGLDKISMPQLPSYLPGLNDMPKPFPVDDESDRDESDDDESDDDESDDDDDESEQSSVLNPSRQSGGKKTRRKRNKGCGTKRRR